MSFRDMGFTSMAVQGPVDAPRLFAYTNIEDPLSEIMEDGYFDKNKILLRQNSFIKIICKDCIAEIVVERNMPTVVMRKEVLKFADPFKNIRKNAKGKTKKKAA